jgi:fibronectin type 3 domain-containing protein
MNLQFKHDCSRVSISRHFFAKAAIRFAVFCIFLTWGAALLKANVPGAVVSGTSPAVTLVDHGSTVTISNGIVSVLCTKSSATITQINYTYNNGAGTQTTQMLNGGTDGGMLYWEYGGFGGSASTYTLVVNPAVGDSNHPAGTYAEIDMLSTSGTTGTVDIHFSMLQGSPGFYVTAIWSHRAQDAAIGMGETRTNIYAGSIFNWMSVDPGRNKLMEVSPSATSVPVPGAPKECYLWTNGIYEGRYDDKYKYSADFDSQQYTATPGPQRVWGWSSVGASGLNLGLWDVNASQEYYNCGPMKRELMSHIGTTILNMFNGDHYAEGMDANFAAGEVWTKTYGPYFVYCNNTSNSALDPYQSSQALYNDALAQGQAETSGTPSASGTAVGATAWPYAWFVNTNYASPTQRGTVTGQIVVSDTGNPNASGSNMFVGLVAQPVTSASAYDFQQWMKPYEFWVQADSNGNFTIPNVIAGSNYTLYAFGPGAESEFMSQAQTGGNPPILTNLPTVQFAVPVTGGSTTSLGQITWTPTRVGATVFEIGYPDRTARKFRHGDDYWVGDIGPSPTSPAPVWTKFLEYPFDFPNGMTYNVGTSRWSTDWNFCQPVTTTTNGIYNSSTGTINFTLASTPDPSSVASIYLGLSSNFGDATIVSLNGNNLSGLFGVTSSPNTYPTSGYDSPYSQCDTTIREGINGLFSDNRITFPGSMLQAGTNTITITFRQTGNSSGLGYFANHLMYDYIRLELSGYVPPAPGSATAYPGNNSVLLTWPVVPGATSYNIYSTTTSGSNYSTIATGVVGPVCGSGYEDASYLDTTASNGTTYYYVVQAANTTGTSANSPECPGVTPSAAAPSGPPAAPTSVTGTATDGQVTLNWAASPNADYYIIQRSTLYDNGATILSGSDTTADTYNTLGTITLTDTAAGPAYTDTTPTDGSTYTYTIIGVNASGTGTASTPVSAVPMASAPSVAPFLSATAGATSVTLTWTPVPGAVGYVLAGGTSASGPFTLVTSITELTYAITGLATNSTFYYEVEATNSGGTSAESNIASATTLPSPPTVTSGTSATGAEGAAFTYQIKATNSPNNFSATGLPAGLNVDPNLGLISGTLMQSGTFPATIYAGNAGGTGQGNLTIKVTPEAIPVISGGTIATGTVGFEFNYQVIANHNPVSFVAAPLPDGVTINPSTGLISGTPTETGTFTTTLSAINYGGTNTSTLGLTVILEDSPTITSPLAVSATNAYAFNYQITATHNPVSFTAGTLPQGLIFNASTGLISGTPTQTGGPIDVPISAINYGGTDSETLAITVLPTPPSVINGVLTATGTNGSPFSYQIQASNNPTSYAASGLPVGLSVDPTSGIISGTLGSGGIYPITLDAINPGGTGTATLMLTITSSIKGMKGVYQGLASVAGTNQGIFNVTLTSSTTGAFTGSLVIPGAHYAVKGALDPVNGVFDSVEGIGRTTLKVDLSIDDAVPGVTGSITVTTPFGSITTYGVQSSLLGTYTAKAPAPTALQGYYTFVIPAASSSDPSQPAGPGYGAMTVGKTGIVTITGKLGTGIGILARAPLHADGKTWTLYAVAPTGVIAGTLTAEDLAGSDADAELDWIRYANIRNVYYPSGFSIGVDLFAAKYAAPSLTTSSGTLTLSGGNLPIDITDSLSISSRDAVTITGTTGTTVHIVPRSGAFGGLFRYPLNNRERAYGGILYLKPSPTGYGLFLGTNQSGSVELAP